MKKNNLVSVVVANYNGERYLPIFLRSLLKSDFNNLEILIVDDASTDSSIQIIRKFQELDSRIILFKNKKNKGAAASRNVALKKIKSETVIFLDNDTELKRSSISKLLVPLERRDVGAAQSLIVNFEDKKTIQNAGGKLIPEAIWLVPYYQGANPQTVKFKKDLAVVAISAALAVKKEVIDKVKGFDTDEAVYTEDLDFCWRIWMAGYKILLAPDSIVYHYNKSVKNREHMGGTFYKIYFHLAKNSFRSIIKNYETGNVIWYLPQSVAINVGRGVLVLIKRGSPHALVASLHALIWIMSQLPEILKARAGTQSVRAASDEYLFQTIFRKGGLVSHYNHYFKKSKLLW